MVQKESRETCRTMQNIHENEFHQISWDYRHFDGTDVYVPMTRGSLAQRR